MNAFCIVRCLLEMQHVPLLFFQSKSSSEQLQHQTDNTWKYTLIFHVLNLPLGTCPEEARWLQEGKKTVTQTKHPDGIVFNKKRRKKKWWQQKVFSPLTQIRRPVTLIIYLTISPLQVNYHKKFNTIALRSRRPIWEFLIFLWEDFSMANLFWSLGGSTLILQIHQVQLATCWQKQNPSAICWPLVHCKLSAQPLWVPD